VVREGLESGAKEEEEEFVGTVGRTYGINYDDMEDSSAFLE
jgi:hypothetical protein